MPISKADFDETKQENYKTAVASAAGVSPKNVDIVDIKEKRRRAGSVEVETKVTCETHVVLLHVDWASGLRRGLVLQPARARIPTRGE